MSHHQVYKTSANRKVTKVPIVTPLLKLPIDMVEDVIVADSLHLLHLGTMKNLLLIYKDGHKIADNVKWSPGNIEQISTMLNQLKLPMEFHRKSRGINMLCHWKASECAVFLNYIGIALLRHFLTEEHYQNFVILFCATTICSTNYFRRFLPVAKQLFKEFIRNYYRTFESASSNIHNLFHIVDEVQRFGPLPTLSSYPFENHLYKIKNMLRSGHLPLPQIINRITEMSQINSSQCHSDEKYPNLKHTFKNDSTKYAFIKILDGLTLTTKFENKWFLTKNNEIVAIMLKMVE